MAQAKENYKVLKTKVNQMDLKELLEPHYPQLLEQTINPIELAKVLFEKGAMSEEENDECCNATTEFCQSLEVYQIMKKKNAKEALIEALYETENYHIIQLLQLNEDQSYIALDNRNKGRKQTSNLNPNNLNIPNKANKSSVTDDAALVSKTQGELNNLSLTTSTTKTGIVESNTAQISILKSITKIKAPVSNEWTETIGEENLSRLEEGTLDRTLARVVTSSGAGNSLKYFKSTEFHGEEVFAILKFIESQLDLDLDKKTIGRPPTEIYVNARSFTNVAWEWLSKLLFNYCRDSLETLWFKDVDYREYRSGTKWMDLENLNEDDQQEQKPQVWLAKLKFFIFQGENFTLDAETFHNILLLIKSINYPLQAFWNEPCQVQIWTNNLDRCDLMIDPTEGTLYINNTVVENLKDEVDKLFDQKTESHYKAVPVSKVYYTDPRLNLIATGINRQLLTHLFLWSMQAHSVQLIQSVTNNLLQFPRLQKLMLAGSNYWTIGLKQLDVLDNLSFMYFLNANCGGVAVDSNPWRKSVRTLIFYRCQCVLSTPGLESVAPDSHCVMLTRNLQQNAEVPPQPFRVSKLTDQEARVQLLSEFRN